MSKKIIMPPLSKKAWQELKDLKVKLNLSLSEFPQEKTFDTYEEYVEDHNKNPPCALFG